MKKAVWPHELANAPMFSTANISRYMVFDLALERAKWVVKKPRLQKDCLLASYCGILVV